jgi:hypothetical protein
MIVAYFTVYISTVVVAAVTALCEVLWCSTRVRSVTYTSIFIFLLILAGPTVPVLNFFDRWENWPPPKFPNGLKVSILRFRTNGFHHFLHLEIVKLSTERAYAPLLFYPETGHFFENQILKNLLMT